MKMLKEAVGGIDKPKFSCLGTCKPGYSGVTIDAFDSADKPHPM
jgi:hypothetical protein